MYLTIRPSVVSRPIGVYKVIENHLFRDGWPSVVCSYYSTTSLYANTFTNNVRRSA